MGEKLDSIKILRAEDLPETMRLENNIHTGFVEVRIFKNFTVRTEVLSVPKSDPLVNMKECIRKAYSLQGVDFSYLHY